MGKEKTSSDESSFMDNYVNPGYKTIVMWALYIRLILSVYGEI